MLINMHVMQLRQPLHSRKCRIVIAYASDFIFLHLLSCAIPSASEHYEIESVNLQKRMLRNLEET